MRLELDIYVLATIRAGLLEVLLPFCSSNCFASAWRVITTKGVPDIFRVTSGPYLRPNFWYRSQGLCPTCRALPTHNHFSVGSFARDILPMIGKPGGPGGILLSMRLSRSHLCMPRAKRTQTTDTQAVAVGEANKTAVSNFRAILD